MVRFFVEELSGGVLAAVKRRGDNTAIILSPAAYGGSLERRVELINRLLLSAGGSGVAISCLELLAS